jgi:hypothetical protein
MEGMGFSLRKEAVLQTLTQDVLKSSDIEGDRLDKDQVRRSKPPSGASMYELRFAPRALENLEVISS